MEELEQMNNELRVKIAKITAEIRHFEEDNEKLRNVSSHATEIASAVLEELEKLAEKVSQNLVPKMPKGGGKQQETVRMTETITGTENDAPFEELVALNEALKIQLTDLFATQLGLKEENKTLTDRSKKSANLKSLISKLLSELAGEIKATMESRDDLPVPPVTDENEEPFTDEDGPLTDEDEPIPRLHINDTYGGWYVQHKRGGV